MTWSKHALRAIAVLGVLGSIPSGIALAQITGHPIEISAGAGMFAYDVRTGLKDGYALSGALGYRLAPWITTEAGGAYGRTKPDGLPGLKASLLDASLDLRFNMRPAEGH